MKKVFGIILSTAGVLLASIVLYFAYLDYIGPSLWGPKAEVDAICEAIQPGMTTAEIGIARLDILNQLDIDTNSGPDMLMISSTRLQVEIHHQNDFLCICQVDIENDVAVSEGEVFCP